jgi:hypothetical protein
VIGAHAVAFHARPRATKDLDILIDPTPANARKVLAALRDFFGGADLGYTPEDVMDPDCIIRLGVAPVRIDLLSAIPGCPNFQTAWRRRAKARFGGVPTQYIGLKDRSATKSPPRDCWTAPISKPFGVPWQRRPLRRDLESRAARREIDPSAIPWQDTASHA